MFFNNKNTEVLEMVNMIESYLKNEINFLNLKDFECSGYNKELQTKLCSICNILNQKNDDELLIYGEIMLISEKIEKGIIGDKIHHTNTKNIKLNYIAKTINNLVETLHNYINQIITILSEYSDYNYLSSLNAEQVNNDFKKLFVGINTLRQTITQMLTENKSNGLILENNSKILLDNVDTLNISSNKAAVNIEETAATLEEITLNVRNNTDNILQMATLSKDVRKSSNEGEELANQTVLPMEEINEQVKLINEAISVIDNISFQTNILSLNAAVESATAGEAGKGFAVVAGEVRNLATRSADAAKRIKSIVENATEKAHKGKSTVNNMIVGYKELNKNILQTINLIEEIQNASKEQLNRIEQINDAVNKLDQQTQQNAIIASQSQDAAITTDTISKLIVKNANSKRFEGKDSITANTI